MTGLIVSNYQLGNIIGETGSGRPIYGVRSFETGKQTSLMAKVIDLKRSGGARAFYNEVSILKKLSGIRGILEHICSSCTDGSYGVIIFPRLQLDLLEVCETGKYQNLCLVCVLSRICEILYQCHKQGIAHMDIKPENILLSTTGEVYLVNFESACDVSMCEKKMVRGLAGTRAYISPQMSANQYLDPTAADMWSLGILAFVSNWLKFPYPQKFLNALEGGLRIPIKDFEYVIRDQLYIGDDSRLSMIIRDHLLVIDPLQRSSSYYLTHSDILECSCNNTVPLPLVINV